MFVIIKEDKANFGVYSTSYSVVSGYMNKEDAERAFDNLYKNIKYSEKWMNEEKKVIHAFSGGYMNQIEIKYRIDEIKMNSYL